MRCKTTTAAALLAAGFIGSASAATVSSTWDTWTPTNIDLTNAEDWGYADNIYTSGTTTFGATTASNRHASGAYTTATMTIDGTLANKAGTFTSTFTNGTSPTTGTALSMDSGFGNFAGPAEDLFTFNFTDVGAGTHTIDMYYQGKNADFTIEATVGGFDFDSQVATANGTAAYKYTLSFTTTDANTDVAIAWSSVNAGSGTGELGAWVANVVPIPEPSTTALLGLAGLALILRRRKG